MKDCFNGDILNLLQEGEEKKKKNEKSFKDKRITAIIWNGLWWLKTNSKIKEFLGRFVQSNSEIAGEIAVSTLQENIISSVGSLQVCNGYYVGCEATLNSM